jgi:hypothetical protein
LRRLIHAQRWRACPARAEECGFGARAALTGLGQAVLENYRSRVAISLDEFDLPPTGSANDSRAGSAIAMREKNTSRWIGCGHGTVLRKLTWFGLSRWDGAQGRGA